jgi:uncharacterized protein (TIGR01619 family)
MGIFKYLSNRSAAVTLPFPAYQEDWAPYLTTVDSDKVGSVMVDLGLTTLAPVDTRPYRYVVSIGLLHASPNGLPNDQEFSTLSSIEESIQSSLRTQRSAVFVGHLFCEADMTLYFYLPDEQDPVPLINEVLQRFPGYSFRGKLEKDAGWEAYKDFLYPLPIQMQSINNLRVIEQLGSHGDIHEKERQVDHWIYFANEQDRASFIRKLNGKGFRVEGKETVDHTDGKPFQLHISRVDKITPGSADAYILDLWQLAHDCNGDYDGWETFIVKE